MLNNLAKILFILIASSSVPMAGKPLKIKRGVITRRIVIPGRIETNPNNTAHVSPRYAGVVSKVLVKSGQIVSKNQRLAQIERNIGVSKYYLKSPIAGTILQREISIGENITSNRKAFLISDTSNVWATFQVRAYEIASFKLNSKIAISSLSRSKKAIATTTFISPVIDSATRRIGISAKIEDEALWPPGMLIEGEIETGTIELDLVIHKDFIMWEGSQPYTFVKENSQFKRRSITLGARDNKYFEVTKGLKEGDIVETRMGLIEMNNSKQKNNHSQEHDHAH